MQNISNHEEQTRRLGSDPLSPQLNRLSQLNSPRLLNDTVMMRSSSNKKLVLRRLPRSTTQNRFIKSISVSPTAQTVYNEYTNMQIFGQIIRWKQGMILGYGSEAQVFKAFDINNGRYFAVKKLYNTQRDNSFIREIEILKNICHKNIVSYLGCEEVNGRVCIYLEFISGGSIKSIIDNIGPLPQKVAKRYLRQSLEGLRYLHDSGIIHRDIKAANILISQDGTVKISDFGCAKVWDFQPGSVYSIQGSLAWTAPEVIMQSGYGKEADIWSIGCTLLEILTGRPPWHKLEALEIMIKLAKSEEVPKISRKVSRQALLFITECLSREKSKRPGVYELLEHPFLSDID